MKNTRKKQKRTVHFIEGADAGVGERVGRLGSRVRVRSDTGGIVLDVLAHDIVLNRRRGVLGPPEVQTNK